MENSFLLLIGSLSPVGAMLLQMLKENQQMEFDCIGIKDQLLFFSMGGYLRKLQFEMKGKHEFAFLVYVL